MELKVARRIIYVYRMFGGSLAGNWLEMYYNPKLCSFYARLTPSPGECCRGNSRFVCDNRVLSAGRFTAMIFRKQQTTWMFKTSEWFRVCFSFAIQLATYIMIDEKGEWRKGFRASSALEKNKQSGSLMPKGGEAEGTMACVGWKRVKSQQSTSKCCWWWDWKDVLLAASVSVKQTQWNCRAERSMMRVLN